MTKKFGKSSLHNCSDLPFQVYVHKLAAVFLNEVCVDFSLVVFASISADMLIHSKTK